MYKASTVIAEVRTIVSENPDFTYSSDNTGRCFYAPNEDNPNGCIIGYALRRLGCEEIDEEVFDYVSVGQLPMIIGSDEEESWLAAVQEHQDSGDTWVECVNEADEDYEVSKN